MAELDPDPAPNHPAPSSRSQSEGGRANADPAGHDPQQGGDPQANPRPPSTIVEGPRSPSVDDVEPVIMGTRCQPCIDRSRHSRCNKVWPTCAKCIAEGTQEFCFEGTRRLASEEAARGHHLNPNRRPTPAPRRTPAPTRSSRAASQARPSEPRRSGSPGRDRQPSHNSRSRSPHPHPIPSPAPTRAPSQAHDEKVHKLMLAVAQAKADLAQAQLDAAMIPDLAMPVAQHAPLAIASTYPIRFTFHYVSGTTYTAPHHRALAESHHPYAPRAYISPPGHAYPAPRAITFATRFIPIPTPPPYRGTAAVVTIVPTTTRATPILLVFLTHHTLVGQVPIPALHAGGVTGARTRPAVIPGLIVDPSFSAVPDVIWKLVGTSGWVTHIPLTYFTDEFISDIDEHHKLEEAYHMTPNGKWVRTGGDKLPDRNEAGMQPTPWFRAWQRFLGVLTSLGHTDLERWRAHVMLIMAQPTFTSEWPLWLAYCITIRRRATREGVDPGILQTHVLNALCPEYERTRLSNLMFTELARHASVPDLNRSRTLAPAPSFAPARPASAAPNFQPSVARAVFPPRIKSTTNRCFICSSTEHKTLECTATTLLSGGKLRIERVQGTNDWTLDETHTCAPSADQSPTLPKPAANDPRRVVTPLIPDVWESFLQKADIISRFSDVPVGLRNGFRLGVSSILSSSTISRNHSSALENPSVINDHIAAEIAAGRYTGPFSQEDLTAKIGFFRTSPLGVIDKASAPGTYRIIQDFSFPRSTSSILSVNAEIDPEMFTCTWGLFPDVVKILLDLPRGSQAATFDVDAAYRRMPIHPSNQPHIVVGWDNLFWVDHCVPFGATSSNGIFGRCGDAISELYRLRGMGPVIKWVDDFLFFRSPSTHPTHSRTGFAYSEEDIYELARLLGWPWKLAKTRLFNNIFRYLGFDWNIAERYVSIPTEKRAKFLQKIEAWLASPTTNLKDTESLLGSLIHCALAIPEGRSRVVGLAHLTAQFSHAHADRYNMRTRTERATEDIRWWAARLKRHDCGSFMRAPPPPWAIPCFMDASTSYGIGVIIGDKCAIWQLTENWAGNGRDIGWAEIVAIELAVQLVIDIGIHDATISLRSDNQGVIGAMKAGRSRNNQQNLVLQRINKHADRHNLHLDITYIATTGNPADAPSRGIHPPGLTTFTQLPKLDDSIDKFLIPRILS